MNRAACRVWVLTGPTAAGKTDVAQDIAVRWGAAIVSADSMLVYRGMDIGTAKPASAARCGVPYLGIDLVDPSEPFDVYRYVQDVHAQLASLPAEQPVIVAGGSGLYVRALLAGFPGDPVGASPQRAAWMRLLQEKGVVGLQEALRQVAPAALAALSDAQNPRRLIRALEQVAAGRDMPQSPRQQMQPVGPVAGLWVDPPYLQERIARRVENMYAAGLLEEVQGLLTRPQGFSDTARQAIGYAEAAACLEGRMTQADAMEETMRRTRRLAKRQRTWFRHQQQTEWVAVAPDDSVGAVAARVEAVWRKHGSVRMA